MTSQDGAPAGERRVVLAARLKPEMVDTYLALHRDPDPAVLKALPEADHHDYRIFRHGTLLVATFAYDGSDLDAERRHLRARPELQDWMTRTAACQETENKQVWSTMEEVFRLRE